MRRRLEVEWRSTAIVVAVAALLSAVGERFLGLPFWAGIAIIIAALLANGLLAEWEDHQPGGFLNPTDEPTGRTPRQN